MLTSSSAGSHIRLITECELKELITARGSENWDREKHQVRLEACSGELEESSWMLEKQSKDQKKKILFIFTMAKLSVCEC